MSDTNLFVLTVLLLLYFMPSIIAFNRPHASKGGILVLNLFLGWTFLGWVIALTWACSGKGEEPSETQAERQESPSHRVLLAGEGSVNADGTSRQDIIASLTVGAKVQLKHDRNNPRDSLSIIARSAGEQIGILPPNAVKWKRSIAETGEATATVASVERLSSGLLGVEVDIL